MAANYKQSNIAGTEWTRSHRVQIDNPYGGTPTIVFHEQRAIALADGQVITIPADPAFAEIVFNPSTQIPLVNPFTGDPLFDADGNRQYASHIEVYILLHSLYMQAVNQRDNP